LHLPYNYCLSYLVMLLFVVNKPKVEAHPDTSCRGKIFSIFFIKMFPPSLLPVRCLFGYACVTGNLFDDTANIKQTDFDNLF
ncbi:MAG: hypothetical protein ACKO96_34770, partial [Flammeovirgaceae bacterium]